jgi:dTDP-3-amino-3,4,6-trideoxy-alpha-D-glucose transaminase
VPGESARVEYSQGTKVVPFLDLWPSHSGLKDAILADVAELIDAGTFTGGWQVAAFEQAYASYCGTAHCVGVSSGLDGLRLALLAAGLEPGDEVIVPAGTFIATLEAVTQAGGRPVLVDIAETDYCLAHEAVAAAVTLRTRAVVPVHLYGQMADMSSLLELVRGRDLLLVEDACQAHGATRDGLAAGAVGLAGAFSFYPAKNLGAFGDAGALVTDDAGVASHARALREHGQQQKYRHRWEGYTARLDTVQALVLLRKLPLLDRWNEQRREAAARYLDALAGLGDLVLPPVPLRSDPVWHLFVIRTADPEGLAAHLADRGIRTGRHYPEAPHRSEAYAWLGHADGEFPVAEALAAEAISLPIFPGITEEQIDLVVEAVEGYFRGA